jgi:hypothetical protein
MSEEIKTEKPNVPWIQTIRRSSGLIEHIDSNGCGHPAAASVHWMELNGVECMGIHGCLGGACQTLEWKLADATEGYKIANKLLFALIKEKKAFKEELKSLKEELQTLKADNLKLSQMAMSGLEKKVKKSKTV